MLHAGYGHNKPCNSAGLRPVIKLVLFLQGCRARLTGKTAGQGCRAKLPVMAAIQWCNMLNAWWNWRIMQKFWLSPMYGGGLKIPGKKVLLVYLWVAKLSSSLFSKQSPKQNKQKWKIHETAKITRNPVNPWMISKKWKRGRNIFDDVYEAKIRETKSPKIPWKSSLNSENVAKFSNKWKRRLKYSQGRFKVAKSH
jgi:hypothetical protein